jgi:hypothetical protein
MIGGHIGLEDLSIDVHDYSITLLFRVTSHIYNDDRGRLLGLLH